MKFSNPTYRRFAWSQSGSQGRPGEIPAIEIEEKEPLPPLEKAAVWINFLSSDLPTSKLMFYWHAPGGTYLRLFCPLNDSRLKAVFREDKSLLEKITAFLIKAQGEEKYPSLPNEAKLTAYEVPREFRELVNRLNGWQKFVKKYDHFRFHYGASATDDGSYLAVTSGNAFRGPEKGEDGSNETDWDEFDRKWFYRMNPHFEFNPATNPPTLEENVVYWALEKEKIFVVLPHESSSESLARYYGYYDAWKAFTAKEKADKQASDARWEEASRANEQAEALKREEEKAKLTNALTS